MNTITPYLFFGGNCREALAFYKKVFGGEAILMTYGEAKDANTPTKANDRIIHGRLQSENLILLCSDIPEGEPKKGNDVYLSLNFKTVEELESAFSALSQNGQVSHALHDAFWGSRFGMLTDQYGFHWMLSFEYPKR